MVVIDNKAIARQFYENAWNAGGDFSIIDALFAADFLNHELEMETRESQ